MIYECATKMLQDRLEWTRLLDFAPGELVLSLLAVALTASALTAPLFIIRYRRLMRRLMSMQHLHSTLTMKPNQRMEFGVATEEPSLSISFSDLALAAQQRQLRIRRATALAYLTFVAGCSIALPMHEFHSAADYASKVVAAAALGTAPAFVNATPRISYWWLVVASTLLLVPAGLLEDQSGPDDTESIFFGFFFIVGFLLVAVHRTWRCIFVPLTTMTMSVAIGFLFAAWLVDPGICPQIYLPISKQQSDVVAAILMLPLALIPVWLGQLLVGVSSWAHKHGFFSDISIVLGLTQGAFS